MRPGGVVLETLSGRKLFVLVCFLLLCQLLCFLVGALIAPAPSYVETVLATKCVDDQKNQQPDQRLLYVRGKNRCRSLDSRYHYDYYLPTRSEDDQSIGQQDYNLELANHIVFAFQLPSPKDNILLDYSVWQQSLIGILQFDISYDPKQSVMPEDILLTINVTLAYRDLNSSDDDWEPYWPSVIIERHLYCTVGVKKPGYLYNCSLVHLFELGSLSHDFYLLNIRIPVTGVTSQSLNSQLGHINDVWLISINQNGGFTKIWLTLKCVFLPFVIAVAVWFWNRVRLLNRRPVLLEYMLLTLAVTLSILNAPLELTMLVFDTPFMPLLQDVRQGVFYASLLSFWLVFAGEHLMIQNVPALENQSASDHLKSYGKHLSAVVVGCVSLFLYDLSEKGAQTFNPFYSIWASEFGSTFALMFIICAAFSACVYFGFLCYMIGRVFRNIKNKRSALPSMSNVRRLHYEGIIYRFKFLMLATLVCAALTVIGFVMGQISEGQWKWNEHLRIEYMSGFFTGVYGMWNVYIVALMMLYAPSHKEYEQTEQNSILEQSTELHHLTPLTEYSPNEISSLTSFVRKTAAD